MAKCEFCEKTMSTGNRISIARSHVSRRALRTFKPNLRTVKVNVDGENALNAYVHSKIQLMIN